jgi:hypothetical protein
LFAGFRREHDGVIEVDTDGYGVSDLKKAL